MPCLDESHTAVVKQAAITSEKMMGSMSRYLQLTTVITAKQRANAHEAPRMCLECNLKADKSLIALFCGLLSFMVLQIQ